MFRLELLDERAIGRRCRARAASASRARPCPARSRASWSSRPLAGVRPGAAPATAITDDSDTPARSASMCPYWLRRTGSDSPSRIGSASATAADCPSTVDRSWRATVRRTMYSTSGREPAAASRTPSAPCFATKSAGIEPLRHDHHDRLHGIRLLERVRALGRSRAGLVGVEREDRSLREPGQQTEVRLPQRRAARGDGVLDARPAPARSRRCSPRPRRPRRCARSPVRAPARLYSTSFFR